MNKVHLIKLRENPELKDKAPWWFSQKWNIPLVEYAESITQCIEEKSVVPQWYVILNESQNIIAGAGVIENDFHICTIWVSKGYI